MTLQQAPLVVGGEAGAIPEERFPLTKIIATLGPATADEAVISKLVQAGAAVLRLNLSHGGTDEHSARLDSVRKVGTELNRQVGLLADLPGPKIRLGTVAGNTVNVPKGTVIELTQGTCDAISPLPGIGVAGSSVLRLSCTHPEALSDVKPGQRVLINDGAVRLLVVTCTDAGIECVVTQGGAIGTGKGVNFPDTRLTIESLTERDLQLLDWAVRAEVDFLGMSFVREAEDIHALRRHVQSIRDRLGQTGRGPAIIAKIELPQAVENIEAIIDAADGIMVARGDLGVEMDLARVPVIQKRLLAAAEDAGKPCIVATQMLESMVTSASPTRAEASDVANAILDGADAVMLSGETSVGQHPVVAVEQMRRIAQYTEGYIASLPPHSSAPRKLVESRYRTAALAHATWTMAQDVGAKCVVVWSQEGGGARYLSQNRFNIPVLAATSSVSAARRMQILWGVTPWCVPAPPGLTQFIRMAEDYLLTMGWVLPGDHCVLMAGRPFGKAGVTNRIMIHKVGENSTE